MDESKWLAKRFQENRAHLRTVAYRMLGSLSEADDAVQEAWLRLSVRRGEVENLGGWLTTVVARVSLDMCARGSHGARRAWARTWPRSSLATMESTSRQRCSWPTR